jgi:ATP-dependent RNA helicase MSS116
MTAILLFIQAGPVLLRRCLCIPSKAAAIYGPLTLLVACRQQQQQQGVKAAAFCSTTTTTTRPSARQHFPPKFPQSRLWLSTTAQAAAPENSKMKDTTVASTTTGLLPLFADMKDLHPLSKKALQSMGLTRMTEIQAKTWIPAVAGRDVLGRARTGTGKTIAFLLPAIERLMLLPKPGSSSSNQQNNNNSKKDSHKSRDGADHGKMVEMLVLSPTRELAAQIADQAGQLLMASSDGKNSNNGGMSVQIMFGGTNRNQDLTRLERKIPTILVSTPGRLKDHLENNSMVKGNPVSGLFRKTHVLVLDETDRLLDMGFRRDVETIISFLPPKQERQTLLFSATLPQEVRQVLQDTMKADYVSVDCIHDDNADPSSSATQQHTNAQVAQSHVILRSDTNLVTGTVDILLHLLQNNNYSNGSSSNKNDDAVKMIVFFSTAKMVAYYAGLFNDGLNVPVWEIHSRKSQSYRTAASNQFREADSGVLFTSDVSARGVDYPDVTHVVQVRPSFLVPCI